MKKKNAYLAFFVLIAILFFSACSKKEEVKVNKEPYSDRQTLMGTYVEIRVYDDGKKATVAKAFARVKELDKEITINQKGSEVDAINDAAGVKPVKVSKDVYTLIKKAYAYSKDSRGGFDLAIGSITQLWRIGFPDARKPSQAEIDQQLKYVDYRKVKLNDKEQTVYLEEKGMKIDLGAIAKGYITDEVVKVLKKNQVTTAVVDLGGNVYVLGHSPRGEDADWTVGIQDPNKSRNTVLGTVIERNKTLVTSGIYERYLEVDGKKYHHLFDSRTGYPFDNDIAGVTIIADKSVDGDGLSTAVFSMGVKKGLEYVESLDDVDAIFVTKADKVYITKGIKDNFVIGKDSGYTMGNRNKLK